MTFQEIIDRVLLRLDTSTEITGDLYTQVYDALEDTYRDTCTLLRPDALLTSATFTLPEDTYTAAIGTGGFEITDLEKEHALYVDDNEDPWINRDYRTWLRGDDQRANTWTLHNNIVTLKTAPPTGDTWALELYYYKTPPAIVLSNSPQFPAEHHKLLVPGVLKEFPHFFQGEKEVLLLKVERDYQVGIDKAKRSMAGSQPFRSLHPKQHQTATGEITFAS